MSLATQSNRPNRLNSYLNRGFLNQTHFWLRIILHVIAGRVLLLIICYKNYVTFSHIESN